LIVDEVLAVGDAEFQKKCLGKMGEVAKGGRTVLFVSHNMHAVTQLCTNATVLKNGQSIYVGTAADCVAHYTTGDTLAAGDRRHKPTTGATHPLTIQRVEGCLTGEQPRHRLEMNLNLVSRRPHKPAFLAVDIVDASGNKFMQAIPTCTPFIRDDCRGHTMRVIVDLPPLVPGVYTVGIWVGSHNTETYDQVSAALTFQIINSPIPDRTFPYPPGVGMIVPISWVDLNHVGA
jgi:lipopolysaccharide transport system ATP-binding protein